MKGKDDKKWVRFGDLKFKSPLRRRIESEKWRGRNLGRLQGYLGMKKHEKKHKIAKKKKKKKKKNKKKTKQNKKKKKACYGAKPLP